MKYFLSLEVARSSKRISISQRKYALEILEDIGYLTVKPTLSPMEQNTSLSKFEGECIGDPSSYRRLVGRLIYLKVTRPNLAYTVHLLSQFMDKPRDSHLKAAHQVLRYIKRMPRQGLFFPSVTLIREGTGTHDDPPQGYCIFLIKSLIT